jgi:hypothetical protein
MQTVNRVCGQPLAPQAVDEFVPGHPPVCARREHRQNCPSLRAAEPKFAVTAPSLYRSEKLDPKNSFRQGGDFSRHDRGHRTPGRDRGRGLDRRLQ